jgi:phenylacetate-CoA ligase
MAGTCEAGTQHLEVDYGFAEYLDCGDGSAELVGTGFYNRVMPLIRYRIGDRVVLKDQPERCACGRSMPIVERVEGRLDDYLITLDGRQVRFAYAFKGVTNVVEAQIIQSKVGEITVVVVPAEKFSQLDRVKIIRNARERLGEDTQVDIQIVGGIPRGPNGKFRAVVCNLQSVNANAVKPTDSGT